MEGLSPFTLYTVRVEACTRFGCTRSPLVQVMTLESGECYTYDHYVFSILHLLSPAPVGLASPLVQITGSTSANISWGKLFDELKVYILQISAQLLSLRCSQ